MKARLVELEAEVRELAQRLSSLSTTHTSKVELDDESRNHVLSSSKAFEAEVRCQAEMLLTDAREECREVMTHLAQQLQNEVEMMTDPKCVLSMIQNLEEAAEDRQATSPKTGSIAELRQEIDGAVKDLRKDLKSNTEALRAELSSMVSVPVKDMRKALEDRTGQDSTLAQKVSVQQADLAKLRKEVTNDLQGLRGDIQKLKKNAGNSPAGVSSADASEFTKSWPGNYQNGGRPPTLEHDVSRGRLRPRPSSSSAPRARKGSMQSNDLSVCVDGDSECLLGLVGAVGSLARIFGFLKDGNEKLGEGELEWAKVGHRFEQSWAAQTKELWQFGMPLRPTIVDFFRTRSAVDTRNAATKMPDRREGARLAERLAAGSSSGLFGDIDSAVRQLSQYQSQLGKDEAASKHRADQAKPAFAGLEALRQMRRQKNE
jgi:hypothetical protein